MNFSDMNKPARVATAIIGLAIILVVLARWNHGREAKGSPRENAGTVPVEVANIEKGTMVLRRIFSGTIEAPAQFTIASEVSGRIQKMSVHVSDRVERGQVVAQLDDAEYVQAVEEAKARLAVAEANRFESEHRLELAQREVSRIETLHAKGIASDSDLDAGRSDFLGSQAALKVAQAGILREEAALRAAEIRLSYTRIEADWEPGDPSRVVAERFVDEGHMVAANTPLLSIVELDSVLAVLNVTEKDYPMMAIGQPTLLHVDAFPGQVFTGAVCRIAPIFRESSRQARIEVLLQNPDHRLKPGMFARCTLELNRVDDAVSVPALAITRRNEASGVFVLNDQNNTVRWVPVTTGLRDDERVQVLDSGLEQGRVVTLGQQMIKDGSAVVIPISPLLEAP